MSFFKKKESEDQAVGKHSKSAVPIEAMSPSAESTETGFAMPAKSSNLALKVGGIIGGILAALLLVVYGLGVFYFNDRFFPNTVLGTTDVSMKATSDLDRMLNSTVKGYSLQVGGDDFSLTLTTSQCGLSVDNEEVNRRILESRSPWLWPIEVFCQHDITDKVYADYDAEAVKAIVVPAITQHNETAIPTENATIAYNKEVNAFSVKPESFGTKLVEEPTLEAIGKALSSIESTLTLGKEQVEQPQITSEDPRLAEAAAQATEMVKADITLMLGENEAGRVTMEISSAWVKLDDEFHVALDEEAMEGWVEGIAKTFDTLGSERKYTRPDGKECVVSGGDYGWKVDHKGLIKLVSDDMAEGATVVEDVPVKSKAQTFKGAGVPDWGTRFIDVDLSEQFVRFYGEDGEIIWESDCVSGLPVNGRSTPMGVYDLNDKASPSVLRGYKPDGEIDYETPVSNWMPFKGNSVGFHDASWQGSFGGDWYKNHGSHGCVNLPVDKAKDLYELIKIGDVISVHE